MSTLAERMLTFMPGGMLECKEQNLKKNWIKQNTDLDYPGPNFYRIPFNRTRISQILPYAKVFSFKSQELLNMVSYHFVRQCHLGID